MELAQNCLQLRAFVLVLLNLWAVTTVLIITRNSARNENDLIAKKLLKLTYRTD
jgi:hypothetical protein